MRNVRKCMVPFIGLGLAACGGDTDLPDAADPPTLQPVDAELAEMNLVDWRNPCRLAEDGDFQAVFPDIRFDIQDQFDDRLSSDGAASGTCIYNARAFRAEDAYRVTVSLGVWEDEDTAYGKFATITAEEMEGVEHLEGFVEGGAYLVHDGEPVTAFMHQGMLIEIGVKHDARATFDGHDPSIALARRIAKRL